MFYGLNIENNRVEERRKEIYFSLFGDMAASKEGKYLPEREKFIDDMNHFGFSDKQISEILDKPYVSDGSYAESVSYFVDELLSIGMDKDSIVSFFRNDNSKECLDWSLEYLEGNHSSRSDEKDREIFTYMIPQDGYMNMDFVSRCDYLSKEYDRFMDLDMNHSYKLDILSSRNFDEKFDWLEDNLDSMRYKGYSDNIIRRALGTKEWSGIIDIMQERSDLIFDRMNKTELLGIISRKDSLENLRSALGIE